MAADKSKSLENLLNEGLDRVASGDKDRAEKVFKGLIDQGEKTTSHTEDDKKIIAQARNQLGVMSLNAGGAEEALAFLDAALTETNFDTVVEANRGLALMKLDRWGEAAKAFEFVLACNPGMTKSRFQLGRCYYMDKRFEEAAAAFQTCLVQMPSWPDPRLEIGLSLEAMGKKAEAEAAYENIRNSHPEFYKELLQQAQVLRESHYMAAAADMADRASKVLPNDPEAHFQLGIVFQELGDKENAARCFKSSLALAPTSIAYGQLAALYEKANDLNNAWATAQLGLQKFPDDAYMVLTIARCERRAKKYDQALARLEKMVPSLDDPILKTQALFQLGWLYDVKDNVDKAFAAYTEGKKLARKSAEEAQWDNTVSKQYIDKMMALDLSKIPRIPWTPVANEPKKVAFLVGFPRSGTTLLNQILDSHPNLVAIEEQPTISAPFMVVEKQPDGYPKALEGLDEAGVIKAREAYFSDVRDFADFDENTVVIDKLPLNLIHLPMIWTMFPDAKVILALRHPMGSVLSCFMHNFRLNNAMTNMFSLDDITSYYADVMALWRHFEANTDYGFHAIRYEDLVTDIKGEAEKLCAYLGVGWSDEMLEYAKHARAKGLINTPSYHQVVQPLYSDSLERWQRYEKYLAPYKERLIPFIKHFGYGN